MSGQPDTSKTVMNFGGIREERQEQKREESVVYVNERDRLRDQGSSSQEAAPDQGTHK